MNKISEFIKEKDPVAWTSWNVSNIMEKNQTCIFNVVGLNFNGLVYVTEKEKNFEIVFADDEKTIKINCEKDDIVKAIDSKIGFIYNSRYP